MLLEIRGVNKSFHSIHAVSDCSFSFEQGKIIGLIGPNGAGKTTLFNLITGFLSPDRGQILFKGEDISGLRPYVIARKGIGRTSQITRVFPKMTLLENLILPARLANSRERAFELLKLVDLLDLRDEYASDLSYGQQKLLSLMQVLMLDPSLILLDEPAAGINPTMQNKIIDLIHQLNDTGKTIIIIEHDMEVIMRHCHRIIVLSFGQKIAEGSCDEIKKNETVLKAYFGR
jgi:ABC-type branched-subunit amino acid transport system ATPase component